MVNVLVKMVERWQRQQEGEGGDSRGGGYSGDRGGTGNGEGDGGRSVGSRSVGCQGKDGGKIAMLTELKTHVHTKIYT